MKNMNKELIGQHFIGGQWVDGQSEEIIQVLNKYDGSVLKEFSFSLWLQCKASNR